MFCWKVTFFLKMIKIMLEAFVLKSILYVYQNARWILRNAPKIYQNKPQKVFFCLKQPLCSVLSPFCN
jgi:hypothetical protein